MALLQKTEGVKPLRPRAAAPASASVSSLRPQPVTKAPPCATVCLAGTDVRGALSLLAQREKLGLSDEEACDRAWELVVKTNPFPATTGRICPHRCEEDCNRHQKDGGVSVGAIERFLGDWGLQRGLGLPDCPKQTIYPERIAIIGAGPAGLSCAYQLVRLGYASTIFEGMPEPGGMFRYGIPPYRLPARVVQGEVRRILDLGVELRTNTRIGRDVSLDELRRDFPAVFVAPGAGASRQSMPGVEGAGVYQGVDFLRDVARGQIPQLGRNIVVVGGGNTAIDVARVCARLLAGKAVITLLRRRNPSMGEELKEAKEEGIRVELRGTINSVVRDAGGKMERVVAEYLDLEAKDAQGKPTLMPIPGSSFELPADAIMVALGQKPNIGSLHKGDPQCLEADANGKTQLQGVWRGGDAVTPTLAAVVITHGRQVALSIDAELRGRPPSEPVKMPELSPQRLKLDWYKPQARLERRLAPVADRLADLRTEVELGHDRAEILAEASRCLSCGSCFGCENCWMYCTPGCMKRLPAVSPGHYFSIKMETCDGCKKCADECPCGCIDMI
jgi:NADPH-dependent glutamate synthase beta subunit-like oxidoreductase/Pyruvate/2-oxoacid:ferredoxin oxidoreductase delta subunit